MIPFLNSALHLRRRSVWEAADSGLLLWRKSFVEFIPFFAIPAWIAACALLFLPFEEIYLSYIAIWWLKPLFDRLALHVVSVRFFNSSARFKDLLRGLPGTLGRGLPGDLLWRRFSPGRGARMPVRVLERPDRKQYNLRKKALVPGGLNFCFLVSPIGLILEGALLLGELIFASITISIFFPSAMNYLRLYPDLVQTLVFAAYCFNYILVESLYVCMGFGIYINSRVEVEGWDLELLFHTFARSDKNGAGTALKTSLLVCVFALMLLKPVPLFSQEEAQIETPKLKTGEDKGEIDKINIEYFPPDFPVPDAESLDDLEMILASKDFGGTREGWGIRFKSRNGKDLSDIDFSPWLENLRRIFSTMLRAFVVIVIAGFLGFALYWFIKYRRTKTPGSRGTIHANSLLSARSPESLFAKAENHFDRDELREAWAACLSGCMGAYARDHSLFFPGDATEYGCLALASQSLPEKAAGFGELVNRWILFAYGGRTPAREDFEKALVFGRSLLGGNP
jgi:hypothetical protein